MNIGKGGYISLDLTGVIVEDGTVNLETGKTHFPGLEDFVKSAYQSGKPMYAYGITIKPLSGDVSGTVGMSARIDYDSEQLLYGIDGIGSAGLLYIVDDTLVYEP